MNPLTRFIQELRRRQVFGVVVIYMISAWGVVQVADTDVVQDMFRVDAELVLLAAIIGLPFAIVAGWFYDITREGISRTLVAGTDPTVERNLGARDVSFLVTLAVVWAVSVYYFYTPPPTDKSIALLPFEVRGNDPDSEIFAAGVREDLYGHLGRIRALSVRPLNSADAVSASQPIDRIARQLNVAYLLKASIERIANRIHVNVSLIDSNSSSTVWFQPYDRELTTEALFQIRRDIATSIAANLRMELSESDLQQLNEQHTENLAAWEAYAQATEQLRKRTADTIAIAIQGFEEAATLDPEFALAHAELAIAIGLYKEYAGIPGDPGRIKTHAEKAYGLDPKLPESNAAMAWRGEGGAMEFLALAVELNPSYVDAYAWLAQGWRFRGDPERAFIAFEQLAKLDPASVPANTSFIDGLIRRKRFDEADDQIEAFAAYCEWCAEHLAGLRASVGGNWADIILADLSLRSANRDGPKPWSVMDDLPYQLAMLGLEKEALRMAFPENEQLLTIQDWEISAAWLKDMNPGPAPPEWGLHSQVYIWSYVGQYELARPAVEQMLQNRSYGDRFGNINFADTYLAECIVAVLRDMGDEVRANEVITELLDNARGFRAAGVVVALWEDSVDWQEGVALYLSGERERGASLIANAINDGIWLPPPGKFQVAMYQEPEIQEALKNQVERQARERKRFLEVVCNDNPYASIWRPMPETCAGY